MPKTPEEYAKLPYHIVLVEDEDDEGNAGWVASVSELRGCMSQGRTPDEAVESVRDAVQDWVQFALEDGRAVPLPQEEARYSGRFIVRLPHSLHAELVRAAEQEGVSLNQFVSSALAGAVGWSAARREPVHT